LTNPTYANNAIFYHHCTLPSITTPTFTDLCGEIVAVSAPTLTQIESNCAYSYTNQYTWTYSDKCFSNTITNYYVVYNNIPPYFTTALTTISPATCTIPAVSALSAEDGCGNTGSVTITSTDTFKSTPTAGNYLVIRTYTVTDVCGLFATISQNYTISYNTAITFTPSSQALTCPRGTTCTITLTPSLGLGSCSAIVSMVLDAYPAYVTGPASCTTSGVNFGQVTCNLGTISGATTPFSITFTVPNNAIPQTVKFTIEFYYTNPNPPLNSGTNYQLINSGTVSIPVTLTIT